jgi:membrane-associated HD superfamily phosphohydrolase
MIADTTEAAVRSKKITNADAAEELIRKLVRDKIDQDQLMNSGLSFDDIEKIIQAFRHIYEGMFHERIKYPS